MKIQSIRINKQIEGDSYNALIMDDVQRRKDYIVSRSVVEEILGADAEEVRSIHVNKQEYGSDYQLIVAKGEKELESTISEKGVEQVLASIAKGMKGADHA